MDSEVTEALIQLRPVFASNLRESIATVIRDVDPYGYALLLGEDLDEYGPIAVTSSEASLVQVSGIPIEDARYSPDEWQHWHDNHFSRFNEGYARAYRMLEARHNVVDARCCYTAEALQFMELLYDMYLGVMKETSSDFPSIWYWVIWIPDSGREIIKRSFFDLNTGRALEEAKPLFDEL